MEGTSGQFCPCGIRICYEENYSLAIPYGLFLEGAGERDVNKENFSWCDHMNMHLKGNLVLIKMCKIDI